MLVPFLIMLREGIEAALIVGIVASYLHHAGRRDLIPLVWVGIFLAVALSLCVGAVLELVAAEFPQKQQELFEAGVGLVAVVLLTSMVFWMKTAAKSIKGQLHGSIDRALERSNGQSWALILMVFLAVAREGLESVFFLLAVFQQSQGMAAPLGAFAGIAVAVGVGLAIYRGGVRLDLRRFFRFTGVFILLVAAGLIAGALRKLHEAGVWNYLQGVVFDVSNVLPTDSPIGAVLSGLFGYQAAPVVGEMVVYLAYLLITVYVFFRPDRLQPQLQAAQ